MKNIFSHRNSKPAIFILFLVIFVIMMPGCSDTSEATPILPATSTVSKHISPTAITCIDTRPPSNKEEEKSLFQTVQENDHIYGNIGAFVTIVVYMDYQCVSCAALNNTLHEIVNTYPEDVRVIFRHFPLIIIHDKAALAAQAVESAAMQNKFQEMSDLLFYKQDQWARFTETEFEQWLVTQVDALGMDRARFLDELRSEQIKNYIDQTWENGKKINLPGTPIILINGELIKWQPDLLNQLESIVKLTLLQKRQFETCPPETIDPQKKYFAILHTTSGTVKIHLFSDKAPKTVNNFVFLARNRWFENNMFFNVTPSVMLQTGDPSGTGFGNPGYYIANEQTGYIYDRAGLVGMANAGIDTNGGQFLISLAPIPQFNNQYPVFGEVVSGMDVLFQLASNKQAPPILLSVDIEEK